MLNFKTVLKNIAEDYPKGILKGEDVIPPLSNCSSDSGRAFAFKPDQPELYLVGTGDT